ncbi:MAG: hypothetical protein K6G40_07465 [Eubacterium sp.]|nr:hypothetical protein [Eubacterium sp.]
MIKNGKCLMALMLIGCLIAMPVNVSAASLDAYDDGQISVQMVNIKNYNCDLSISGDVAAVSACIVGYSSTTKCEATINLQVKNG